MRKAGEVPGTVTIPTDSTPNIETETADLIPWQDVSLELKERNDLVQNSINTGESIKVKVKVDSPTLQQTETVRRFRRDTTAEMVERLKPPQVQLIENAPELPVKHDKLRIFGGILSSPERGTSNVAAEYMAKRRANSRDDADFLSLFDATTKTIAQAKLTYTAEGKLTPEARKALDAILDQADAARNRRLTLKFG